MRVRALLRKLFDRQLPEMHPVRQRPELSDEQQRDELRECLARLHDQVWWLSLPWYERLGWWLLDYEAPMKQFYETEK